MDKSKSENKKGVISQMWRRCKSFSDSIGKNTKSVPQYRITTVKSGLDQNKVAPVGCFPVYVGAEKERFVMRTEQVNHPLFRNLLEEAESEYGYGNKGPLMLPCEVGEFVDVMMEVGDYCDEKLIRPTLVTALAV